MTEYSHLDDKELSDLLKTGQQAAFTEIYNRYWKLLYNSAHNIIQDQDSAQDAVQDVFISLWQRKEEVDIQNLKAYLQQSVRFGVLKRIRAKKTDDEFYQRLADVTLDILTDDPLIFKEQQTLLNNLLDNLPEDCKEAFHLSREENFTYKQIAAHLSISEKTVEKRMSKSLKYLRNNLNYEMCVALLITVSF